MQISYKQIDSLKCAANLVIPMKCNIIFKSKTNNFFFRPSTMNSIWFGKYKKVSAFSKRMSTRRKSIRFDFYRKYATFSHSHHDAQPVQKRVLYLLLICQTWLLWIFESLSKYTINVYSISMEPSTQIQSIASFFCCFVLAAKSSKFGVYICHWIGCRC